MAFGQERRPLGENRFHMHPLNRREFLRAAAVGWSALALGNVYGSASKVFAAAKYAALRQRTNIQQLVKCWCMR